VLELRELIKHYSVGDGEPVRAVDGVSMSIGRGELVALYGPSGSGKTTLLLIVAALVRPDSGSVQVDGREVTELSYDEGALYRLNELGYVDQSFDLLPGANVLENASLKLWLTGISDREVRKRLKPLLARLGLEGRLKQPAEQLSMGERQRVMIARALSTEPKLVLADEPTGNLDTQRGREVLELLRELCLERGTAILLVTHDPQAAGFADRVHALRDGRLVEHDPGAGAGLAAGEPARAESGSLGGARTGPGSGGPARAEPAGAAPARARSGSADGVQRGPGDPRSS
jgi:putative ABC transport system ATP-binding protein